MAKEGPRIDSSESSSTLGETKTIRQLFDVASFQVLSLVTIQVDS